MGVHGGRPGHRDVGIVGASAQEVGGAVQARGIVGADVVDAEGPPGSVGIGPVPGVVYGAKVEIVGIGTPKKGKRVAGLNRGKIRMSDDFDAPLPDEFWLGEQ